MNEPLLSQSAVDSAPYSVKKDRTTFKVEVTQSIVKEFYVDVEVPYESEKDEDGNAYFEYDTEGVDWKREWQDQCLDIKDLLRELRNYAASEQRSLEKEGGMRYHYLQRLIEACEGWREAETYVEQA